MSERTSDERVEVRVFTGPPIPIDVFAEALERAEQTGEPLELPQYFWEPDDLLPQPVNVPGRLFREGD